MYCLNNVLNLSIFWSIKLYIRILYIKTRKHLFAII